MGKIRKREWTLAEIEFVKKHAASMKDEDIATHLRRNLKSVREKRRRLKISKASGRGVVALKGKHVPKSATIIPDIDNTLPSV